MNRVIYYLVLALLISSINISEFENTSNQQLAIEKQYRVESKKQSRAYKPYHRPTKNNIKEDRCVKDEQIVPIISTQMTSTQTTSAQCIVEIKEEMDDSSHEMNISVTEIEQQEEINIKEHPTEDLENNKEIEDKNIESNQEIEQDVPNELEDESTESNQEIKQDAHKESMDESLEVGNEVKNEDDTFVTEENGQEKDKIATNEETAENQQPLKKLEGSDTRTEAKEWIRRLEGRMVKIM